MIVFFIILYSFLFVLPFVSYGKAVSIFWVAIILYPHKLFNIIPGGINIYDVYLVYLFLFLIWKRRFIIASNRLVSLGFGIIILMLFSEYISMIFLQNSFVPTIILQQFKLVVKLFEYGLLALLVANVIRYNYVEEKYLIQVFLFSIVLLSIIGIFQIFHFSFVNVFYNVDNANFLESINRATGSTKGPWIMGALTAIGSIISLNLIIEGPQKDKILYIIIFLFSMLGLILSRSRASWLMFLVSIPFFLYYSKNKVRFLTVIGLSALVLVSIPFIYNTILFRLQYTLTFGSNTLDTSSLNRILQWKELLDKFELKYIFTGYGKYSANVLLGWDTLHNLFLSIVTFNGIAGLLFFGYFYLFLIKTMFFLMKKEEVHYLKSVWKGIFISLLCLLVYSLTADTFYSYLIMLSLFYLGAVGYERKIKYEELQSEDK